MNTRGGWVSKVAALAAVALLTGCKAAMVIRVENHGPAVQVTANCGDANFDQAVPAGRAVEWQPTANACFVTLDEGVADAALGQRALTITARCLHHAGCSFKLRGEPTVPSLAPDERVTVDVQATTITRR